MRPTKKRLSALFYFTCFHIFQLLSLFSTRKRGQNCVCPGRTIVLHHLENVLPLNLIGGAPRSEGARA